MIARAVHMRVSKIPKVDLSSRTGKCGAVNVCLPIADSCSARRGSDACLLISCATCEKLGTRRLIRSRNGKQQIVRLAQYAFSSFSNFRISVHLTVVKIRNESAIASTVATCAHSHGDNECHKPSFELRIGEGKHSDNMSVIIIKNIVAAGKKKGQDLPDEFAPVERF